MADRRFFTVEGPFTLAELSRIGETSLADGADPNRKLSDVAPLDTAGPNDISFLDNNRYLDTFRSSKAGACIARPDRAADAPQGMALLLTPSPYRAYALIAQAFYPGDPVVPGKAATAIVDPSASIGQGTEIGPGVVIGAQAEIGANCRIGPNVVIGPGVAIGDGTVIHANASLRCCLIGKNVQVFAGARIGEDGFGFAPDPSGHVTVPQLGRVIVGDAVEIGANSTIDRGSGPDTVIGEGCRIDNLVQIGHNVRLGKGCIIVGQVGISGSTAVGDYVVMAGQAGVAGHLRIGDGARIAAQSGIAKDIPPGESVGGTPAVPIQQWLRQSALLTRLTRKKT